MYVTGRNGTGNGTILSALAELSKTTTFGKVVIAALSNKNEAVVKETTKKINDLLSTNLNTQYIQLSDDNEKTFSDFLLEEKFDCSIVSIPDPLHYKYTRLLLEQKVHTLVVKPLVCSYSEGLDLFKLQRKNNLHCAVEFHKRFDETNLYTKKLLKEEVLGKLAYFTIDYSQRIEIPLNVFRGWADKTNIFQYLGVHYVDLIYFLTGFLPVKLMAVGTAGILEEKGINTFDSIHASVLWQNKNQVTFYSFFNVNWIDPSSSSALSDQKYKIIGSKGRIELDQKNRGVELVLQDIGVRHCNPYFSEYLENTEGSLSFQGYAFKSISLFITDIEKIKQNKIKPESLENFRPSFKQALISAAVLEAVSYSLENNNCWREINDFPEE